MNKNDQVIHVNPSAKLYYELALKEFDKMKLEKAIKYFKRGISLAKDDEEQNYGRIQLALLYQHNSQFKDSENLIEELLKELDDEYPDLYYFQAINFMYSQMKNEAKESIHYYMELASSNSPYQEEAQKILESINNT